MPGDPIRRRLSQVINAHAQIATGNQQTDRLGIIRIAALLGDGRYDGVGRYLLTYFLWFFTSLGPSTQILDETDRPDR